MRGTEDMQDMQDMQNMQNTHAFNTPAPRTCVQVEDREGEEGQVATVQRNEVVHGHQVLCKADLPRHVPVEEQEN
jgi:hypothetical protein